MSSHTNFYATLPTGPAAPPPDPVPLLLAMGSAGSTPVNYAAYSIDGGTSFSQCTAPAPAGGWFGAAYSPSLGYSIMISNSGSVAESTDGITWTLMPGEDLDNSNWQGGVIRNADDSLFVATALGGTNGLRAATSPDGVTWTLRTTPSGTFGSVVRIADNGYIVATGSGGIIRSIDGGITWTSITSPGDTNSDIVTLDGTDYLHVVGNTSSNAGDTYFSNDFGDNWTKCFRNSLLNPPNQQAGASDPTRNEVYMAGTSGIWKIDVGDDNTPNFTSWSQAYAAGVVGGGCRGGYISALDTILFVDHSGSAGFRVHQNTLSVGTWSTQDYPSLLVNTARVRLQFLPIL